MHELEMKLKDVREIKEKLTEWTKEYVDQGRDCVDTEELGEVVDMIKDLAKVEKSCWEAKYFESIVKAMEEAEDDNDDFMGYNSHRSARTGRYISGYSPSGAGNRSQSGTRMGYNPVMANTPFIDEYLNDGQMNEYRMMGYGSGRISGEGSRRGEEVGRHGRAYNEYEQARRHYTQTQSMTDKQEMDKHAHEHIADAIATVRDIWTNADPDMRKRMKSDFEALVKDMAV